MKFLERFKRPEQPDKLRAEIEKNKELVLDVMGESIQGSRICPLIQKKCIGKFCEFFLEFNTKDEKKYSRCAYVAAPLMTLEAKIAIEQLHHSILTIVEAAQGVKK